MQEMRDPLTTLESHLLAEGVLPFSADEALSSRYSNFQGKTTAYQSHSLLLSIYSLPTVFSLTAISESLYCKYEQVAGSCQTEE
jgi:hypothetical protein